MSYIYRIVCKGLDEDVAVLTAENAEYVAWGFACRLAAETGVDLDTLEDHCGPNDEPWTVAPAHYTGDQYPIITYEVECEMDAELDEGSSIIDDLRKYEV